MEIVEEIKKAIDYTKNKEYKNAENIYLNLLKVYPENASVLSFIGLLYFNTRQYRKAEKYLVKAYSIFQSKNILFYIGMSKYILSKYNGAVLYLKDAVENNKTIEVYKPLIISCSKSGKHHEAYKYASDAHELFPFDEDILCNLALSSIHTGRFKEGEIYTKKLLALNPKSASAWYNFGLLEEILYGNEKRARECYRNMVKCGDKIGGYNNLAISYSKDKKNRKKEYYYLKKTEKLAGESLGLNFLYASYFLSRRLFTKGYKYYVSPDIYSQDDIDWFARFKRPWTGGSYKNETLFVYGDQGLGDQLQFCRYLPFLDKKFKSVKVMVPESLIGIFKRSFKSFKNIRFYPRKITFPKYDKSVLMSRVIYYLNKKFNNIPFSEGYLIPDEKKVREYKSKYFTNNKPKIGICWEAGAAGIRDHIHRTLNIEYFEKVINIKNADVFSFQVKPSMDSYKKYPNLIDLGSSFETFDDTAAALMNIDVLITVDTSIAHLAGALGVKTFLILPYCPDWRWFDNSEKTEWYNSVRIFKQKSHQDWSKVFENIFDELNNPV